VAIADPRRSAIRQQMIDSGRDVTNITFYDSADEMLGSERLDGVVIGTRCSQHTSMALKVIKRGLAVFLEKPVSTNMADLEALRATKAERVVVSFPLRVSTLVDCAREIIQSGKIGTVEHVQAWNNVPYGWVYYQTWYRDEEETGGLFLQKATHDFDYINSLLEGRTPTVISAMTSKRVFTGSHRANLRCMDCSEKEACHESPYDRSRTNALKLDEQSDEMCSFAVDTGNEDSGSCIIQYDSGMHVVYSQNFFARKKAAKRGATFLGYKGTLEFDWYTGLVKVFMHHEGRVETYDFGQSGSHGGGDTALALNFVRLMRGEEASIAPLDAGLLSALMCLKARESAMSHTFQAVEFRTPNPPAPPSRSNGLLTGALTR
jgi:predicted dehydrogenase